MRKKEQYLKILVKMKQDLSIKEQIVPETEQEFMLLMLALKCFEADLEKQPDS